MMLTDVELLKMRSVFNRTLTEMCEVRHKVSVRDGAGDQVSSWPAVAYSCAGRVAAVSGKPEERVIAEKLTNVEPYVIVLPRESVVYEGSRIHVGSRVFEVVAGIVHTFELGRRVICKEIK